MNTNFSNDQSYKSPYIGEKPMETPSRPNFDPFTGERIEYDDLGNRIPKEFLSDIIKNAKKTFSRLGISLIVYGLLAVVFQFAFAFILGIIFRYAHIYVDTNTINYILVLIPMYVLSFPIMILTLPKKTSNDIPKNKIPFLRLVGYFIIAIPAASILNVLSTILAALLSGGEAVNSVDIIASEISPLMILTVVILGPMVEELIFRKFLIDRTYKYGEGIAIFFSAVCFGLFHMNLYQIFYAFTLGLILGYIYCKSGKIHYTMFIHMAFNFWGSVVPLYFLSNLNLDLLESIEEIGTVTENELALISSGDIAYLVYVIVQMCLMALGVVLFILYFFNGKFKLERHASDLPKGYRLKTAFINVGAILFIIYCIIFTIIALFA